MNSITIVSILLTVGLCSAATVSYTGTLANPESTFLVTANLTASGNVTLQTYNFSGGSNAAGTVIPAGGFDAFVGLFQGVGPTAVFLDGTADNLSNYTTEPSACPPAGLVTIGTVTGQCGDVRLRFTGLAAEKYTQGHARRLLMPGHGPAPQVRRRQYGLCS